MKAADVFIAGIVLAVVMLLIIPLSTSALDVFLVINITVSIFILITTLYIKDPLEFSILPTILLIVTLFRLALNVASTKLILGNGGEAGSVIATFGNFVTRGNLVVGFIVFIVIVAIQFIVITKGSERVSEVAARFTLDAMPGKQMAIDADLNTGAIDEAAARKRREDIQREADFYGAMDGASKFIKGDAIIGIIIMLINLIGGLVIGVTMGGMQITDALSIYAVATVGDGLVGQIPALLVSTSTGIMVTRSTSQDSFGVSVSKQLFDKPYVMIISAAIIAIISLIPGFPKIPAALVAVSLAFFGYRSISKTKKKEEKSTEDKAKELAKEKRKPENMTNLLQVEPIEMEFGYGIIPMVDANLGGDLLERVVMIRRQCALEMGIIVPSIRLRDNVQLGTNEYVLKIKGNEIARGEVMIDHFLAINIAGAKETISGIETTDPAFNMPALWITKNQREKAELLGYTTIDPPSVIATHLTELIKRYGHELLNRQQVQTLLDALKTQQPALVDEVYPKMFSLGDIQKVLMNLLREGIPIRDMATIVETLADYGNLTKDTDLLTEYVRQNLKRLITKRFITDGRASVITLDPRLEQLILERSKQNEAGPFVAMDPAQLQSMLRSLKNQIEKINNQGKTPVVLTSPLVRRKFRRLVEQVASDLTVLSYGEVEQSAEIHAEGVVAVQA
ncbi:flagellar biosynthesis protein FlhA [Papillibacter cinnamivorans]|uniref:Flagellar biosynthesis protein FlhA n=1 Tax=Papillibacter cinnamivorans DSM 12816 TaxID=1122930 RepID=A0A1W1YH12_9FIRM|nr:flagellar biosynthesis protein FlhA [Papillibacter cinnamivorans]SMC35426.1 flagellar biosynthesis protein FlhA [Papillibacter cinnamivorans DSM 12816]